MRFRTLEIRWHDSKPISTCDFQPVSFKKARPALGQERNYPSQAYRLATGGEDNHVRLWMVYPNIRPPTLLAEADSATAANIPRPPRVEYLATLSRHSAAVNVVHFSPNGELIASAGDDGMIIIWAPSTSPPPATYGSDLSPEDLQHEKEYWKPRTTFRCTTMQVYDLAWSPTGEYIIAGSTDNTARIFTAADGKCVYEIAEHSHYVQGVAWDPLNEYIATQSSDRSMHIYRISTRPGGTLEVHAVGKNTRMPHKHSHSRTPSGHGNNGNTSRPKMKRRESIASDMESNSALDLDEIQSTASGAPLTPALSVASTPAFAVPPPPMEAHSRRSSFSSNAPGSPTAFNNSRYGRSPSPMPPLPAIRSLPSSASAAIWASVRLYGDESYTNFFRRLTFSPDGGLLLTPAGQFEDPSVTLHSAKSGHADDATPTRGRKGHPSETGNVSNSTSSVYIYSRANFARPPIAQLPGHQKASVAVRFSPILYELRPGVLPPADAASSNPRQDRELQTETRKDGLPTAVLERGVHGSMDVDVVGPVPIGRSSQPSTSTLLTPQKTPLQPAVVMPSPQPRVTTSNLIAPSPTLSPLDLRPPTPAASKPSTPVPSHSQTLPSSQIHRQTSSVNAGPNLQTGSVFALPYRLLFAVVTMDTVAIYDTQQAGPICLLTKLHYDEFTDMSWSPDGQCLILSSRDGYCTLIIFDDILPAYHTQQHTLQLQSIAQHHAVPLTYSNSNQHITPAATPASANVGLPFVAGNMPSYAHLANPKKREPPLTAAGSAKGVETKTSSSETARPSIMETLIIKDQDVLHQEPPKKKRRVILTRVGESDS